MKKHWKFSTHFAERFVERGFDKPDLKKIVNHFNSNVLQEVFKAVLRGDKQRVRIDNMLVCYKWDSDEKVIVVTTIYGR